MNLIKTLRITSTLVLSVAIASAMPATVFAAPKNPTAIAASSKHTDKDTSAPTPTTNVINPAVAQTTTQANVVTAAATTQTTAADPSGNNGFIKVNEEEVPDSIPNNDPHVGCTFKVEFYNYDKNPNYRADMQFVLQNPTKDGRTMTVSGNTNPFIGQDGASGGNDLDAVETYRLAFTGAPHDKHGYHVKLTIHADGSRGADVKHKVFWVQPCETPATPSVPTTPGQVLGTSTTPAATLPSSLPSTGSTSWLLALPFTAAIATFFAAHVVRKIRA